MANGYKMDRTTAAARVSPTVETDPCRRWVHELVDLRGRVRRVKPNDAALPAAAGDILEDALDMCASVVQELAGLHLAAKKLTDDLRRANHEWDYLFDQLAVPCLLTDSQARILSANRSAALFLNVSAKHLRDRLLLHFTEDRDTFADLLRRLEPGPRRVNAEVIVRPRERAPRRTGVVVVPQATRDTGTWLWFFESTDPATKVRRPRGEQPSIDEPVAGPHSIAASTPLTSTD